MARTYHLRLAESRVHSPRAQKTIWSTVGEAFGLAAKTKLKRSATDEAFGLAAETKQSTKRSRTSAVSSQ